MQKGSHHSRLHTRGLGLLFAATLKLELRRSFTLFLNILCFAFRRAKYGWHSKQEETNMNEGQIHDSRFTFFAITHPSQSRPLCCRHAATNVCWRGRQTILSDAVHCCSWSGARMQLWNPVWIWDDNMSYAWKAVAGWPAMPKFYPCAILDSCRSFRTN